MTTCRTVPTIIYVCNLFTVDFASQFFFSFPFAIWVEIKHFSFFFFFFDFVTFLGMPWNISGCEMHLLPIGIPTNKVRFNEFAPIDRPTFVPMHSASARSPSDGIINLICVWSSNRFHILSFPSSTHIQQRQHIDDMQEMWGERETIWKTVCVRMLQHNCRVHWKQVPKVRFVIYFVDAYDTRTFISICFHFCLVCSLLSSFTYTIALSSRSSLNGIIGWSRRLFILLHSFGLVGWMIHSLDSHSIDVSTSFAVIHVNACNSTNPKQSTLSNGRLSMPMSFIENKQNWEIRLWIV